MICEVRGPKTTASKGRRKRNTADLEGVFRPNGVVLPLLEGWSHLTAGRTSSNDLTGNPISPWDVVSFRDSGDETVAAHMCPTHVKGLHEINPFFQGIHNSAPMLPSKRFRIFAESFQDFILTQTILAILNHLLRVPQSAGSALWKFIFEQQGMTEIEEFVGLSSFFVFGIATVVIIIQYWRALQGFRERAG